MSRKNYIQHLRSAEVETTQEYGLDKIVPKLPEYEDILDGEIAINQHSGVETIVLRNDDEQIVKFLNENVIYENEEITAAALSHLQNEIGNLDRQFYTKDEIDDIVDEIEASGVDLTNYYTKEESNALLGDKVDYYTYNSIEDMNGDVNINNIRLGSIAVVEDARNNVKTVYVRVYSHGDKTWYDITTDVDTRIIASLPTYEAGQQVTVSVGDSYDTAIGKLIHTINDNERVTAEALTDLETNKADTADLAAVAFSGDYDDLSNKPTIGTGTSVRQNIKTDDNVYKVMLATVSNSGDIDEAGYTTEITHNPNGAVKTTTFNTTVVENGLSQSVPLTIGNGGVYFGPLATASNDYINGETYTGRALASETQIMSNLAANEEAYADGASLIGYYDEKLDQEITVRQALTSIIETFDDIEVISAGTGLNKSGSVLNHSNSVTANNTSVAKAFTYDSEGHITSSVDAAHLDINQLATVTFEDDFLTRCEYNYASEMWNSTGNSNVALLTIPTFSVTNAASSGNNGSSTPNDNPDDNAIDDPITNNEEQESEIRP